MSPPRSLSLLCVEVRRINRRSTGRTVARYTPHGLHRYILTAGTPRAAARHSLSGANTQHVSQRFRPSGHEHQHGRGCQGRRPRGPAHAGAGGGPEGLRGQKGADRGRRVQGPRPHRRQVRQNDPEHGALRRRPPDRGPVQGGAEPAGGARRGAARRRPRPAASPTPAPPSARRRGSSPSSRSATRSKTRRRKPSCPSGRRR